MAACTGCIPITEGADITQSLPLLQPWWQQRCNSSPLSVPRPRSCTKQDKELRSEVLVWRLDVWYQHSTAAGLVLLLLLLLLLLLYLGTVARSADVVAAQNICSV